MHPPSKEIVRLAIRMLSSGIVVDDDFLEFIDEGYGGRKYHNEFHAYTVVGVMSHFAILEPKEMAQFVIAAYFHDMCQIPQDDKKAVEMSAESMASFMKGTISQEDIDVIKGLILATGTREPNTKLEEYFCDADFAIIGAEEGTYDNYTKNLKQEILDMGFDESAFEIGRVSWLAATLKKEILFFTEAFGKFEWKARKNLRREYDMRVGKTQ